MKKTIQFFLISFLFSLPFWLGINIFQQELEKFLVAQISVPYQDIVLVQIPEKPELNLSIKAGISLRLGKSGKEKILFRKNSQEPLAIASLTKLITALVVLTDSENYDFSKVMTISKDAAGQENVPEYGNLKSGEKKTIAELLNLMLVYSSNDAAFALSEARGQDYFMEEMNKKAESLCLNNTHFVNPTGLDPENIVYSRETLNYFNFSTAEDLLKLSKYILNEFPLIFEISLAKPGHPLKNGFSDLVSFQNKDLSLIGSKTGYTDQAGGCLVLILNKGESYIINIILGADSAKARVAEMEKLLTGLKI